MVYFIQAVGGGRIKIGTTIRLTERLIKLAKDAGSELRVLAVIDGDRKVEKGLHKRFSELRAVGEWFEPGDDLLGFIVQEGRKWNGKDELNSELIAVRCRPTYKAWVLRLAKENRTTPSQLVDLALIEFATNHGFTEKAPER